MGVSVDTTGDLIPFKVAYEKKLPPLNRRFGRLLDRLNQTRDVKPSIPAIEPFREDQVVTDQKLIEYYYRNFKHEDAQAIATDRYMERSKDTYNEAWLARELVQNFVDHNPAHPGTLDGVRVESEVSPSGKGKRFVIEGDWPFSDVTGVISPHSEKPEGMNTAGGNGIGLKQAAIRLLRDFGVTKFEIQGEGWVVNYKLAKADEINEDWGKNADVVPLHRLKHDWLIAEMKPTETSGKCVYIIETEDAKMIRALDELATLGVSEKNEFLQNPDFKNEHGAIKWLPLPDAYKDKGLPKGRLFVNGQVMNYKTQGQTAETYWTGPELATLQLNNIQYQMSVDRPPINSFDLSRYLTPLIDSMTKDDLVTQINKSKYIWTQIFDGGYSFDREGCFIIIEKMIGRLAFVGYKSDEYQQVFADLENKYLCFDRGATRSQLSELEKQGFIICPSYFEKIGMPKASSKLSSVDAASNIKPDSSKERKAAKTAAEEYGIQVGYERMDFKNNEEFFHAMNTRLSPYVSKIESVSKKPNTIRISLNEQIPENLLSNILLYPNPDKRAQQMLYLIRGIIKYGLTNSSFDKIFLSQGDYVTTFATGYDFDSEQTYLVARNIKSVSSDGVFLEMELNEQNYLLLFSELEKRKSNVVETESDNNSGEKDIAKRASELKSIPIQQPPRPEERKTRVVEKNIPLSDEEEARLKRVAEVLPEVERAVGVLGEIADSKKPVSIDEAVLQYVSWRSSEDFYGEIGDKAGYLTGRHLVDVLNEQNQADIASVQNTRDVGEDEKKLDRLNMILQKISNKLNPVEDEVDEFEIVLKPSEAQLAQLALLRSYSYILTGVALPNDLFIYRGTGSKAVNLGKKAIGLHEELFKVNFTEALSSFMHEIAHNEEMNHDNRFIHTVQALFVTTIGNLQAIGLKASRGQSLLPSEQIAIDIQNVWNELRKTG